MTEVAKKIKELQNLYSWNQFYQRTKNRASMSECQTQIRIKKQEVNELKMAQKAKRGGKK